MKKDKKSTIHEVLEEENKVENANSNLDAVEQELEEDRLKEETEHFEKLYQEKEKANKDLNDRFMRLQADFNNYKKRTDKEKENIYAYGNQEIMSQLLLVVDNFERALASSDKKGDDSFYQGVEMVYKQLMTILEDNGLKEIEALGEKFDPNLHHGVAQETSEEHDEDIIIDVFQKGYKINDKVIRPSMVKISN